MLDGRHDVEHGQPRDALGMIERQPVRHPGAAVVADDQEPLVAEVLHHLDHVAAPSRAWRRAHGRRVASGLNEPP